MADTPMKLKIHKYARLFPTMPKKAYEALKQDLRANGQRDPILITPDNEIVDGVHRYRALSRMDDREPEYKVINLPDKELLDLVMSKNMHRRHLTDIQKVEVIDKVTQQAKAQGGRPKKGDNCHPSLDDACEKYGVDKRQVQRYRKAKEKAEPEVMTAVSEGKMTVNAAVQASELDADDQKAVAESDNPKAEVKKRRRKKKAEAAADDSTTQHTANAAPVNDVAHDDADVDDDQDTAVTKLLPAPDGVEAEIAVVAVIEQYGMGQVFEVMKTYGDKEQGENTPWNAPVLKLKTEIKSLEQELDEALANLNKAEQSTTSPNSTLHEFKTVVLEEEGIDWRAKEKELWDHGITQQHYVDGKRPDGQ